MPIPLIILGGGGHAKVLINTLRLQGRQILGFADPKASDIPVLGVTQLGGDEVIFRYSPKEVRLVNGVGSIKSTAARRELYERFFRKGYQFEQVIHPSAVVASDARLEAGVQIMAGVVVQPGTAIGANSVVNTSASLDHDCAIGSHVHVAPGAVLSGNVRVGDGAHIGTGASIIQGVTIGAESVIGAGAVVIRDVPAGVTSVGVPARALRRPAAKV